MSLFSTQEYICCMCGAKTERTCNDGTYWALGVCTEICRIEKQWRETLSIMGKEYRPDPIHGRITRTAHKLGQCLEVFGRVYHAFDTAPHEHGCKKPKWMDPSNFRHGGTYYDAENPTS